MEEKINGKNEARLMKGNEALAEAAIRAGMDAYFGYPITPQSEILEYFKAEMPKRNGVVLQAESEVAAINMIYGAAGAGGKSYDFILKPRNKFNAGRQFLILPAQSFRVLLVNVVAEVRDLVLYSLHRVIISRLLKAADMVIITYSFSSFLCSGNGRFCFRSAFDLQKNTAMPAMILADGALGQMMEKVVLPEEGSLPNTEIQIGQL